MSVAIAVVSHNTRDLLARCLASMRDEDAEVWVVDNASTDGSADMVRERFGDVRLVESDNIGFGPAVNIVGQRTSSDWLAAANADIALTPGALDALLTAGADDPGAGAVAPRLVLPDGSTQHSVYPFPTLPFTTAFALGAGHVWGDRLCLEGRWDPDRPRRVPWAVGAFLLLRRPAWNAIGGFDERRWMYAEDLDLGWSLHHAGWATRYVPDAVVLHDESASTSAAWGEARTQRWMDATYAWMRDRRGPARTRAVAAVNVAGSGVRAAAFAPLARASPERFGWRRGSYARWARAHRDAARRALAASSPSRTA